MAVDKVVVDIITNTDKSNSRLKKFAIAVGVATVAIGAMIKVGKDLVDAYAVQEQAEARLEATIKSTGSAAGLTSDQLIDMAKGLQGVTKFGDEAIIGAESLLLTFKDIGGDIFPRALESILDVSEAMGQDLKSSTVQLGKALNDPVGGIAALTRVGIQFTDKQKDMIKALVDTGDVAGAQGIILEELESQFGGVAVAAADTATGGIVQLSNASGDLKEALGKIIAEGTQPVVTGLTEFIEKITEAIEAQQKLNKALDEASGRTFTNTAEGLLALKDGYDEIQKRIATVTANIKENTNSEDSYRKASVAGSQKALDALKKQAESVGRQIYERGRLLSVAELARLKAIESIQAEEDLSTAITTVAEATDELTTVNEDLFASEESINIMIAERENLRMAETSRAMNGLGEQIDKVKELKATWEDYASSTMGLMNALNSLAGANADAELQSLDEKLEAEYTAAEAAGATDEELSALKEAHADELDKKKRQIAHDEAIRNKALGLMDVAINTAIGISKAIPNPVLIAFAAAIGAVQAAAILATPVPAYATGGSFIADKPQMIQVGEGAGSEKVTVEQASGSTGGGGDQFRLLSAGGDFLGWIQREGIDNRGLRSSRGGAI